MGIKFYLYGAASTACAVSTLTYALHTREQFYPTVVFLVTSKFSIVVLGNFAIFITLMMGQLTKLLFLGQLRDQEREIMFDKARYTIFDTCLTLTIFHEEITVRVCVLFTALLFSKVFHWLSECRVEHVEQDDNVTRWQHIRLASLLGSLIVSDLALMSGCAYLAYRSMPSVLILFAFEYANLAVTALATFGKYVLHVMDMRVEGSWQAKWGLVKMLEIISEAVRFVLLLFFFGILFMFYGMPLHVLRELGMSFMNLQKYVKQFKKYRKLMSGLNDRFPDATVEEMQGENGTMDECIICRDALAPGAKKLPCDHIFHLDCLRLWLHEKNGCPTCRAVIPLDGPRRTQRNHAHPQMNQAAPEDPVTPPVVPVQAPTDPRPAQAPTDQQPAQAQTDPRPAPAQTDQPAEVPIPNPINGSSGAVPAMPHMSHLRTFVQQPRTPISFQSNGPPPPLVLRTLSDVNCISDPSSVPRTTRSLPANAFVLAAGVWPQNSFHSPSHWMTVDGDWLRSETVECLPVPSELSSLQFGTGVSNPYASSPFYNPAKRSDLSEMKTDSLERNQEVSLLSQEIDKLRSELTQLKQMTEVASPSQTPTQRPQSSAGWAESPFIENPPTRESPNSQEGLRKRKSSGSDNLS